MRKAIIFAVLFLANACTGWDGWDDVPTAKVTAKSELPSAETKWREIVAQDVAAWNNALTAIGCQAPFEMSSSGHPVILVPFGTWGFGSSVAGMTDEDRIRVQASFIIVNDAVIPHPVLLLHELGHALGLNHSDAIFGPSAMTPEPTSDVLQPRDIAAAACAMGCGSCDLGADHFDN